jgi:hypothetical protein
VVVFDESIDLFGDAPSERSVVLRTITEVRVHTDGRTEHIGSFTKVTGESMVERRRVQRKPKPARISVTNEGGVEL